MPLKEALSIVLNLAIQNLINMKDYPDERAKQDQAIKTVLSLQHLMQVHK